MLKTLMCGYEIKVSYSECESNVTQISRTAVGQESSIFTVRMMAWP